jgi:hypothetical protein
VPDGRLEEAWAATAALAAAYAPADLYRRGFRVHEQLRPSVPAGEGGWGAIGEMDLAKVRGLIRVTLVEAVTSSGMTRLRLVSSRRDVGPRR